MIEVLNLTRSRTSLKQCASALLLGVISIFIAVSPAFAQIETDPPSAVDLASAINNVWVLTAAILVFMMQLGFAMLESGFNAAKNTVNVLFKNVIDVSLGTIVFFVLGYAIMFQPATQAVLEQVSGFAELQGQAWWRITSEYMFLSDTAPPIGAAHLDSYVHFFFQAAFAATAITICSGAVAGRMKPWAYLLLAIVMSSLVYPVSGYWVWGNGPLARLGLVDFAGSLVVHSVGGAASLASLLILGPRMGRFTNRESLTTRQLEQLASHNLPIATLGMFVLWVGWYGFNIGSALGVLVPSTGVDPSTLGLIALNTTLAACMGGATTTLIRLFASGRIELSMVINGVLGGLVAITASCNAVEPVVAILIGAMAALFVILGVEILAALHIDDAVGAFAVHGICGSWGAIAAGLFVPGANLAIQLLGAFLIPLWSFIVVFTLLFIVNRIGGIRVNDSIEQAGLDFYEHGENAYIL